MALDAIAWKYYLVYVGVQIVILGTVYWFFLETKYVYSTSHSPVNDELTIGSEGTLSKRSQDFSMDLMQRERSRRQHMMSPVIPM